MKQNPTFIKLKAYADAQEMSAGDIDTFTESAMKAVPAVSLADNDWIDKFGEGVRYLLKKERLLSANEAELAALLVAVRKLHPKADAERFADELNDQILVYLNGKPYNGGDLHG